MWYVVQVRSGTEDRIVLQCQNQIDPKILERCFIAYYETRKKIRGKWITQQKILFPGYVFVVTERPEELRGSLRNIAGLTKLIGTGEEIVPLSEEEVNLLIRLGGEQQIVEMSEGIIEHSRARITSGPLQGLEGCIKKIDRHKRKAWLEVPMFGRMQRVEVGLEIVEKIE